MLRFLLSLLVALLIGAGIGLYLGWVQFPAQYDNSPASALAEPYQDDYTVMIAAGFLIENDTAAAVERLRWLGVADVPAHVQRVTERYIENSQDIDDLRALVALAESLNRLTPAMEPYRRVSVPGQTG
jgi:hypothetical protein